MRNASISIDLDNKWSYLKTHGDPAWETFPSYLATVVPRILDFLDDHGLKITFFIVGQDAALEENHEALATISARGHDIGSHSFNHEPWLHLYTKAQINDELAEAERWIEKVTGVRPKGFRGPGYSLSAAVLDVLAERGYEYDATIFPNVLNPIARAYFLATSDLSKDEKEQRKALFGSASDALRPVKPFWWRCGKRRLLEIPVTTMPLLKIPIHMTYIHYLGKYSSTVALLYFRIALALCRLTGTEPSLLLHPSDFLGKEDDDELRFFPGMDLPVVAKTALVHRVIVAMKAGYELVNMREHAARIAQGQQLRELESVGI